MKAYVMTSGTLFSLLALAHVLRVLAEGLQLAWEPVFTLTTLAAVAMSGWAWRVWRLSRS